MAAEIKYTPRFLKLDENSSLEESKLAYDEMAPNWEKVNKDGTPSPRGVYLKSSVNCGQVCAAKCLKPWHFFKDEADEIWYPQLQAQMKRLHFIAGFHMTSLNFKLQNNWSSWDFTFMVYKSS